MQDRVEEILNSVTHGIGAGLSVAGLVLLVVSASLNGDARRVTALAVFGAMLVLLYLASTLYHAFRQPELKRRLQLVDHAAIYLLIAGTYTPVALVHMGGAWGWTLFGLIWGLALVGIVGRTILGSRWRPVSLCLYLAMGWAILLTLPVFLARVPPGLIGWLLLGGLSYSLGVIPYRMRGRRYHHAVWHLFVLGGSVCHFFGLLLYTTAA